MKHRILLGSGDAPRSSRSWHAAGGGVLLLAIALAYSCGDDSARPGDSSPPAESSPKGDSARADPAESKGTFDHSPYTALLQKHVDDEGRVAYRAWKDKDLDALDGYLRSVSETDPKKLASREERIAFWVNAYNALTIRGIIEFYPMKSIKDKVNRIFGYNIWTDYKIEVGGRERSLDEIEHRILRKMGEPRIHFALVCASLGCPKLSRDAYRGADLEEQLDRQAREFLNDPERTRVDRSGREVYLSKIFKWFDDDFGGTEETVLRFIAPYRPEAERDLLLKGRPEINYLSYDWSLNDQQEEEGRVSR